MNNEFFEIGKKVGAIADYAQMDNYFKSYTNVKSYKGENGRVTVDKVVFGEQKELGKWAGKQIEIHSESKAFLKLDCKDRYTGKSILMPEVESFGGQNLDVLPSLLAGYFKGRANA